MRISPLDIRQQQFTVKWFRGFDIHEVDAFLDDVAEDYETVLKENAQLKEQVATFEERSRGLNERERALQDTLVTTHRLGDEMKATARREAELQMREAELRSEKIIEEGRAEEARIRGEIQTLRRVRRQLIEDFRATLESYYRMMSAEFGGWQDTILRLRVTAAPVAGAANAAVAQLLARALDVPPSAVSVVKGLQGRAKIVEIAGLGRAEIQSRLSSILTRAS